MGRPAEFNTVTASPAEEPELRALSDHLVADGGAVTVRDAAGHEVPLPGSVVQVLTEAARQLAAGNAVTLVPTHVELTTQQAADLLNVSRPYLVRLLEAEAIPYDRIGTHRRLRLSDVLEYRQRRATHREAVLRRMAARGDD